MELPHVMGKLAPPVAELDLKSLFHHKVMIQPYLKTPSPVPLLFPQTEEIWHHSCQVSGGKFWVDMQGK